MKIDDFFAGLGFLDIENTVFFFIFYFYFYTLNILQKIGPEFSILADFGNVEMVMFLHSSVTLPKKMLRFFDLHKCAVNVDRLKAFICFHFFKISRFHSEIAFNPEQIYQATNRILP